MGLVNRLFNRPLSQDGFAKLVIKRLRASGEMGSIEYDQKEFRLRKSADHVFFLQNIYQQTLAKKFADWRVGGEKRYYC